MQLRPAIAHNMNEIIAVRRKNGLPVFNLNQGLVQPTRRMREAAESAFHKVAADALWKMGSVYGLEELRIEIAEWRRSAFKQPISKNNVFITVGASNAYLLNLLALTAPEDKVELITPYFFNHFNATKLLGRQPIPIFLQEKNNFSLDLQLVSSSWDSSTKLLLLSNPHNPTGKFFQTSEIKNLETVIRKVGGKLLIDESYLEFDRDRDNRDLESLDLDITILQGSFSKSLSLGDLRIGYIIASEELTALFPHLQDNLVICPPTVNQQIVLEILKRREELLPQIRTEMKVRSRIFDQEMKSLIHYSGITNNSSGVFKWVYLGLSIDDREFAFELAKDTGVVGTPGTFYGAAHWIRFTFGMIENRDALVKACKLIRLKLEDVQSRTSRF